MRNTTVWAALFGLALSASACAYGVVEDDDDDEQGSPGGSFDIGGQPGGPGGGSDLLPGDPGGPSEGGCYVGSGACNPMKADCGSDQACDASAEQGFACFPGPNDAELGAACDPTEGPFCVAGATCVQGSCRAYCCTTADCDFGTCESISAAGGVTRHACLP